MKKFRTPVLAEREVVAVIGAAAETFRKWKQRGLVKVGGYKPGHSWRLYSLLDAIELATIAELTNLAAMPVSVAAYAGKAVRVTAREQLDDGELNTRMVAVVLMIDGDWKVVIQDDLDAAVRALRACPGPFTIVPAGRIVQRVLRAVGEIDPDNLTQADVAAVLPADERDAAA